MNILIIKPKDINGKEYNIKALFLMCLQGHVRVNLDEYFPYRMNVMKDYKELLDTIGCDNKHKVIITTNVKGKKIHKEYLKLMDIVIHAKDIQCEVPRGPAGIPIGWDKDYK